MADPRERAAFVALLRAYKRRWSILTELVEARSSALAVLRPAAEEVADDEQPLPAFEPPAEERATVSDEELAAIAGEIDRWEGEGFRFTTALDDDYPSNLRAIYNRPPFLFVQGSLRPDDRLSVAVVGTRAASAEGERRARKMARQLAGRGVTVVSGLAAGIDTAAHEGALEAGGRTIAVIGTGIRRAYPAQNAALQHRIGQFGAVVSQFWPDAPPQQHNFPMRNVITSGISLATVVIEASHTSGAKMQARLALDHGKRVFLLRSLVEQYPWAREYAARPGATVVSCTDEVINVLHELLSPPETLLPQ